MLNILNLLLLCDYTERSSKQSSRKSIASRWVDTTMPNGGTIEDRSLTRVSSVVTSSPQHCGTSIVSSAALSGRSDENSNSHLHFVQKENLPPTHPKQPTSPSHSNRSFSSVAEALSFPNSPSISIGQCGSEAELKSPEVRFSF